MNQSLVEVFENEQFRKIFPRLFSTPISVTQLEKETKVSRTTIYNFFKILEDIKPKSYIGIESFLGKKDKFYYFKTELLVDYLKERLKLTQEETYWIKKFLDNIPSTILKKELVTLEDLLFRLIGGFVIIKLCENFEKSQSISTYSFMKRTVESLFKRKITPEEIEKYVQTIKQLSTEKSFNIVTDKILNSEILISMSPVDFYIIYSSVVQVLLEVFKELKKRRIPPKLVLS